jgi:hypothetical protein
MRIIADPVTGLFLIGRPLVVGSVGIWEYYDRGQWNMRGQEFASHAAAEFKMERLEKGDS